MHQLTRSADPSRNSAATEPQQPNPLMTQHGQMDATTSSSMCRLPSDVHGPMSPPHTTLGGAAKSSLPLAANAPLELQCLSLEDDLSWEMETDTPSQTTLAALGFSPRTRAGLIGRDHGARASLSRLRGSGLGLPAASGSELEASTDSAQLALPPTQSLLTDASARRLTFSSTVLQART